MKSRVLGLHPTVLVLAATHFLVDGFGNILAPLLPLLIVNLNLSLAAAGTSADVLSARELGRAAGLSATSPTGGDPGCSSWPGPSCASRRSR